MRAILLFVAALTLAGTLVLRAEPAAPSVTEAPKGETARQMLKRGSKVFDLLDLDAAMALHAMDNDKERESVKIYCKYAIELTRLEHAIEKKFGRPAADDLIHAAREKTLADIDDAKVEEDGDKATLTYKDGEASILLKRVDGAWKIDVGLSLKDVSNDELAEYNAQMKRYAAALPKLTKEVEAGDHASAEPVIAAVKKLTEPPPPPQPGKGGL